MQLTSPQRGVGALVLKAFLLPLGVKTSQFGNGNRQQNSYVTGSLASGCWVAPQNHLCGGWAETHARCPQWRAPLLPSSVRIII